MTIIKQVETVGAYLELTDTGIVIVRYKEGVTVDVEVARASVAAHVELCGEIRPAPVLACLDQVKGLTRAARQFFAEADETYAVASHVALLVSSPIARVIANFVLALDTTRVPTRSFTRWDRAMAWLEQRNRAGVGAAGDSAD